MKKVLLWPSYVPLKLTFHKISMIKYTVHENTCSNWRMNCCPFQTPRPSQWWATRHSPSPSWRDSPRHSTALCPLEYTRGIQTRPWTGGGHRARRVKVKSAWPWPRSAPVRMAVRECVKLTTALLTISTPRSPVTRSSYKSTVSR
jgi:hypothetical protein